MKKMKKINKLIIIFLIFPVLNYASPGDTTKIDKRKINNFFLVTGTTYAGGMILLHQLWYKHFEKEPWHIFNDNREWLQMDKMGHIYNSFHITDITFATLHNAGMNRNKSMLLSAATTFLIMTPIEWLDGYSSAYGASPGDFLANLGGIGISVLRNLNPGKSPVSFKYSYIPSPYADLRSELLGKNLVEKIIKDYNSHAYWVSMDIELGRWPKWLNLAVGYSANEMVFARTDKNIAEGYENYRQFFFGIDLDLSDFEPNNKFLNKILRVADAIRIPFPTLEFSQGNITPRLLR